MQLSVCVYFIEHLFKINLKKISLLFACKLSSSNEFMRSRSMINKFKSLSLAAYFDVRLKTF